MRGRVLCGGDVVRGLQVARDGVGVPDHVLVADLTRVLHVLVDRDTQPSVVTCLRWRIRHKLVIIFIQTEVMATNMALKDGKYFS